MTAVPAIGLNLLFGYAGLVSLGQMGFAGVGAYAPRHMLKKRARRFVPALLTAVLASAVAGLLVGMPCLRLRSHFFIIVTLGVGIILVALFNNLDSLTEVRRACRASRVRARSISASPCSISAGPWASTGWR